MVFRRRFRTALCVAAALSSLTIAPAHATDAESPYAGLVVVSSTQLVRGEAPRHVTVTVTNMDRPHTAPIVIPATVDTDQPTGVELSAGSFDGHRWVIEHLSPGETASLRYTPL